MRAPPFSTWTFFIEASLLGKGEKIKDVHKEVGMSTRIGSIDAGETRLENKKAQHITNSQMLEESKNSK